MKRKLIGFFGLAVFVCSASAATALTVLQLNLHQLTDLADRVFVGTCVSVRPEVDPSGRPVQYVTYQVREMLKGPPSERVTFKQLGVTEEQIEGPNTVVGVFRELPRYQVGEESIVFLSEAGVLGLTAPIGLGQGKFTVKSAGGGKTVVNGMDNHGLFLGLDRSPQVKAMSLPASEKNLMKQNGGEVGYDEFVSLVKRLATP